MVYDPLNRVVSKFDAGVKIQELTYNASHVQTNSTDARGNTTKYSYDKCNRLIATIDPEEHSTLQSYDTVGNIATKTDGNGNVTTYSYDQFNRLLTVTNAKDEKTSYTYDSNGNMLTQTDGKGNVTTYEYNAANKPIRKIDHGGKVKVDGKTTYQAKKTETYTYYPNALMATKIDRNGKTTNYTYDIYGRLLSKKIDSNEISYTYDANGNQLTMTDSTGITARTYDELNRVKIKTVPNIGANTFQYDIIASKDTIPELSSDQIKAGYTAERLKDAKGNITTKVSDLSGRLVYVIADGKVTSYTYDENGNRASVVYPGNDTKEVYTYDKDNLLHTLTNTVNGVEKDKYTYTYDGAHNQSTKLETINQTLKGTTTYSYDSLNRLTEVVEPKKSTETNGKVTSYTYDAAGNRETEKVKVTEASETKTSVITYQYNEQNRLLSTSQEQSDGTKKTTTYCYDNNGNLTKKNFEQTRKIDPSNPPTAEFGMFIEGQEAGTSQNAKDIVKGIASYEYDVWNQLVKATTGEGTSTYQYNGEGYRTERTENGITTRSLYEADKVILETDKKGKQIARKVYGTNLLVRTAGEDTFYYMYNGHGDVTGLIDANGKTRATYYYDAFGNPDETGTKYYDANGTVVNEAVNNNITYAGYQYDKATGLYYLNARMYDPKIARFMSEDTYLGKANDPLSLNLYTYCINNPITYTDPTGHVVKKGDSGSEVKRMQILLGQANYDCGTLDGKFGKNTQAAVIQYQKDHNLKADGIIGEKTLASLRKDAAKKAEQERHQPPVTVNISAVTRTTATTGSTLVTGSTPTTGSNPPVTGSNPPVTGSNPPVTGSKSPTTVSKPTQKAGSNDDAPKPKITQSSVEVGFNLPVVVGGSSGVLVGAGGVLVGAGDAVIGLGTGVGVGGFITSIAPVVVPALIVVVVFSLITSDDDRDLAEEYYNTFGYYATPCPAPTRPAEGAGKSGETPEVKYPGNDPAKNPGEGWEWRGKGEQGSSQGSYTKPETGEVLHPDLEHPTEGKGIGPHWDYKDTDGTWHRIFPDGTIQPK